jgi:DNA-binding transcriptional LysR family regulator
MSRARLNIDHLATLLALVESGNFNAAGVRVGLAQPTVSQHLKQLEQALGAVLIVRGQRGCKPTAAALRLLPYARSLLRLEQRVVEAAQSRVPRLGACSNIGIYMLPALLRNFQRQGGEPPALTIGTNPAVVDSLERAEVDAALLEWWDERDGFDWQPWRTEPFVVIVSADHPLASFKSISREELAHLPMIGGEEGTGTGRILQEYFAGTSTPNVTMRLGSTEAVKRAVEAGLGVSIVLACSVEQEIREGRLYALPLRGQPLTKSLRLVWRNDLSTIEPLIEYLTAQSFDGHPSRL